MYEIPILGDTQDEMVEPVAAGEGGPSIREELARLHADAYGWALGLSRGNHLEAEEVLHLVFYQGLTLEESAAVVGISAGSARTHYERGKARLRELLAEERR